jgi:hypothetical protein
MDDVDSKTQHHSHMYALQQPRGTPHACRLYISFLESTMRYFDTLYRKSHMTADTGSTYSDEIIEKFQRFGVGFRVRSCR